MIIIITVESIEDNVKSFGRISRIFLRLLLILIRKIRVILL